MRLPNVETLQLKSFFNESVTPYAVLPHIWGKPSEEVQYRELKDGYGYTAIAFCQATGSVSASERR
jgi:hypothetical protein